MPIELDYFTQQYLITALWSSCDDDGDPFDSNYSIEDIADDSILLAIDNCNSFKKHAGDYLGNLDNLDETQVAHDFWLTRNYHGAGFWDGDYDCNTGEFLTKLAHTFGESDVYLGDNGYLYLSHG